MLLSGGGGVGGWIRIPTVLLIFNNSGDVLVIISLRPHRRRRLSTVLSG